MQNTIALHFFNFSRWRIKQKTKIRGKRKTTYQKPHIQNPTIPEAKYSDRNDDVDVDVVDDDDATAATTMAMMTMTMMIVMITTTMMMVTASRAMRTVFVASSCAAFYIVFVQIRVKLRAKTSIKL